MAGAAIAQSSPQSAILMTRPVRLETEAREIADRRIGVRAIALDEEATSKLPLGGSKSVRQ
jgi:hypothetical protein